jgi:hypothetical protein
MVTVPVRGVLGGVYVEVAHGTLGPPDTAPPQLSAAAAVALAVVVVVVVAVAVVVDTTVEVDVVVFVGAAT